MSGFRRQGASPKLTILVNGQPVPARAGESVALALLAAGHTAFGRRPADGSAVGPFCLMGVCARCNCTIGGRPGEQACLVTVEDGLEVEL